MKYLLWLPLMAALAVLLFLVGGIRAEQRSARAENAALLANIVRQADLKDLKASLKALETKLDTVAGDAWEQQQEWKLLEARLNEAKDLARGAACLSAFTLYVMGISDGDSAYEYFVRRPAQDCENPGATR